MSDPTAREGIHITPDELDLLHDYLRRVHDNRPKTRADQEAHYHALIAFGAVAEMVLTDATARDGRR